MRQVPAFSRTCLVHLGRQHGTGASSSSLGCPALNPVPPLERLGGASRPQAEEMLLLNTNLINADSRRGCAQTLPCSITSVYAVVQRAGLLGQDEFVCLLGVRGLKGDPKIPSVIKFMEERVNVIAYLPQLLCGAVVRSLIQAVFAEAFDSLWQRWDRQ